MNLLKIVGSPVVLIIIYLLLIIEGDNFGGFFLLYLVLALPHGAPYALLAALGIACLIVGFNLNMTKRKFIKPILYLFGYCLMVGSLIMFFGIGNKWATFELTVPLFTFILFAFCSIIYLLYAFSLLIDTRKEIDKKINPIST
ncbi:MAG: hypothetical protein ACJ748_08710 [Flavisolibacter sp.]